EFFRAIDSRNRGTRFRDLGLINEPNCGRKEDKDVDNDEAIMKQYGLYVDKWNGDPYDNYPGQKAYKDKWGSTYPGSKDPIDDRHSGGRRGIVGLRLSDTPAFPAEAKKRWDVNEYFANPGKMEPPFLVGFSCGFCHVSFDPNNPPKDSENPR